MKSFMSSRIVRALFQRSGVARVIVAAAVAGLLIAGCDVHGISDPGTLTTLTIAPNPVILEVNGTQLFSVVGKDYSGANVTVSPTWSVEGGGGTISSAGLFTAGTTPGTFTNTVRALTDGIANTATVIVIPGPLATLVVTPNPVVMGIGATQQFLAVGRDAAGNAVPFTPTWSVVAGGGSVNNTGFFSAGSVVGTFTNTIKVSSGAISATATVTVTPGPLETITVTPNPMTTMVGATQQFTAVGRDLGGNVVSFMPAWSVVSGGGTIGSAGLFTAGTTPGTFANTVMASSGGVSGTATVIVTAGPLATIEVTPNPATLAINATEQFTAVGRDVGGNVVPINPTWSVVAGGGAIDISTGLFTAGATVGTYTNSVRASVGGLAGFATVIVTGGPLVAITVTPNPVSLLTHGVQQFIAVGTDAGGNVFLINPVWSVVAGGGTINGSGVFTAGTTPGTFPNTVKASSGAISGTATVTVNAGVLASITVTPNPATMAIGNTQQFHAVGRDGAGNVVAISPTWSVVAGGGTINLNTGLFTAGNTTGTYTNSVHASVGAVTGSATVVVTSGPLASITVTPNPVSVLTGGTRQYSAVGRDAGNNVVAITPVWSVVAGGGTISNTGLFTAGLVLGTFTNTVKAASGGISGFATVTVTAVPPVLTSITVTPRPVTMPASSTQQFSAQGWDQYGNVFPISPIWSVANGGGTINSGTGLFTAGALAGVFNNTVKASSGLISGTATVTVTVIAPPPPLVDLGAAALNGIMAGQSVTCIIGGIINADVAISPGNTLTGYPPCVITGTTHLADAVAAQGQIDLTAAYNALFALPCPPANAIVADLGGTTKPAGVYCTASGIGVTGSLTLDGGGDPNATFVFQAGTSLITAGNVVLINGAQAKNVYWLTSTSATLGTASQWQGNIIALTSITLVDNATLTGRALARNGSVTLGTNNVIILP